MRTDFLGPCSLWIRRKFSGMEMAVLVVHNLPRRQRNSLHILLRRNKVRSPDRCGDELCPFFSRSTRRREHKGRG